MSRRKLPHWYVPGALFFITYRLHGTLPNHVLEKLRDDRTRLLNSRKKNVPVAKHRELVHRKLLHRTGTFWQAESYDHWVRDEEELERIVNYIAGNPVSAGLVKRPEDWFFCSCHDRFLMDGEPVGCLRWA